MVPGCRCAPKKLLIVRASKPTARPKPAKPSSSPSGRRNRAMSKANPCATQDRSLIRPRLKAPRLWIPVPTSRTSRRAYSARPAAVVSAKLNVRWCWAMVRIGFGTRLRNYSRKPLRFLTAFMPKEHLSQVGKIIYGDSPEGKPWIQARYEELDEGCLKSMVQALHGHAGLQR